MSSTTDFNEWIENSDPDGFEDVHSLHCAVEMGEDFGGWSCNENNGRWFVKSDSGDQTLVLASQKARDAFLEFITRRYCGELEMDGWYSYMRAMAKDD